MTIEKFGGTSKCIIKDLSDVYENLDTSKVNWVDDRSTNNMAAMVMFTKD